MQNPGIDPIAAQIVWNRLLALVEEQAQVLMRTAFSPVVREAGDLSAGVFDARGRMLAQAVTGTPGHVNAMAASVGRFLERYPLASLADGDVLLTNDPWDGTGHLNDFTVVTPVFLNGGAVALFASTSHIADVGGRGFGPDASEVFEEGLNIPISKLFARGELNETLMEIVRANVRDPVVAQGDLYSLVACNDAASRRLVETMREFDLPDLDSVGELIVERSRTAMIDEISALPRAVLEHGMTIDGYDTELSIHARLTIEDERIIVDFSGSSGTSGFGINVPLTYTQAYASFGVRCVIGNDVPNNAGSLDPVVIRAPEGCVLNARRPAAVSARHAIGQMLPDVVLGCLAQVIPERVPAEGASCIWNPVLLDVPPTGMTDARHTPFVINPIFNGGTGARSGKDGLSTTAFPSGVRNTPVEVNEVTSPLIVWRKEYLPDSGGAGRQRGGLGQVIEISHGDDAPFAVSKMFDRIQHPARGRDGGAQGTPGRVYLKRGDVETELRGKGRDTVPPGATLVMETPGGGGIGPPGERDPDRVEADRLAGFVSMDHGPD